MGRPFYLLVGIVVGVLVSAAATRLGRFLAEVDELLGLSEDIIAQSARIIGGLPPTSPDSGVSGPARLHHGAPGG